MAAWINIRLVCMCVCMRACVCVYVREREIGFVKRGLIRASINN